VTIIIFYFFKYYSLLVFIYYIQYVLFGYQNPKRNNYTTMTSKEIGSSIKVKINFKRVTFDRVIGFLQLL